MSERDEHTYTPENNSREYFAQLMEQLEACGCGPAGAAAVANGEASVEDMPSACGPVLDNLFELLDHAMPEELERMMLEHSEHCDHCGPAVDAEIKFRQVLKRSCSEQAPDALRAKIASIAEKFAS
ncbi:MAG: hypothetical protein PT944_03225 [Actinomycetaceae bacterium]|nr:hypothetical protein [Arcanobacterium sp.]MDD7686913.1 hypothetical protein [Actinomycetaceae bacterium]MDY5273739.1 hypothetical protein [Arcanobacterium sp.]